VASERKKKTKIDLRSSWQGKKKGRRGRDYRGLLSYPLGRTDLGRGGIGTNPLRRYKERKLLRRENGGGLEGEAGSSPGNEGISITSGVEKPTGDRCLHENRIKGDLQEAGKRSRERRGEEAADKAP